MSKEKKNWIPPDKCYEMNKTARAVNLIDYLAYKHPDGLQFDRKKNRYFYKHHSLEIYSQQKKQKHNDYSFYDWSNGTSGDNIQFLESYLNRNYVEAINELNDYLSVGYRDTPPPKITPQTQTETKEIKENETPPEISYEWGNNIMVYAYLQEVRVLDSDTVQMCFRKNILYADRNDNCVFFNPKNNFFSVRSSYDKKIFKQTASGNERYWEFVPFDNEPIETLYICEAPIDCLSLWEIMDKPHNTVYIAMCGLNAERARHAIDDYKQFNNDLKVYISCDWDEKGNKFYDDNFRGTYIFRHPSHHYEMFNKDWNETLAFVKIIEKSMPRKEVDCCFTNDGKWRAPF